VGGRSPSEGVNGTVRAEGAEKGKGGGKTPYDAEKGCNGQGGGETWQFWGCRVEGMG